MKHSKTILVVVLTIAILVIITACSADQTETQDSVESISITDALNRTIELEAPPQNIVVGGNGSIMIVDAIFAFPEANDRVIGYAKTNQGHGSFTDILDAGEKATVIDNRSSVEETAALAPDLVLLKSYMKDMGDGLELLGIPVVYMDLESLEQYRRDLSNLGLILDNPERAEELITYYENIVSNVSAQTQDFSQEQRPSVLFIYYNSKDNSISFNVPPLEWAQTTMIITAGGSPVWSDIQLESKWTQVNLEQIAAWNPDLIFLTAYFDDVSTVKQQLLDDDIWNSLDAVKNGNLYAVPMGFYSWDQPHTRWGITQQWLAAKIQPQTFSDFAFETKAKEAYEFLYNIDAKAYEENILPKLQGDFEDSIP